MHSSISAARTVCTVRRRLYRPRGMALSHFRFSAWCRRNSVNISMPIHSCALSLISPYVIKNSCESVMHASTAILVFFLKAQDGRSIVTTPARSPMPERRRPAHRMRSAGRPASRRFRQAAPAACRCRPCRSWTRSQRGLLSCRRNHLR